MTKVVVEIPTIETERLRLRAPELTDLEAYAAYRASARSHLVGGPFARESTMPALGALVGHWHFRGFGRWIVADKTSDEALGVVGPYFPDSWPEPEIAWTVFGPAEGKGIAYEAALAARAFAYETLGWSTAVSLVSPENARSLALAARMGTQYESDYDHPDYGRLGIYRHPAPEAPA